MKNEITLTREEAEALIKMGSAVRKYLFGWDEAEAYILNHNVNKANYLTAITAMKDQLASKEEPFYPLTSICKDDLRAIFKSNRKALKRIDKLDDSEMQYLADKVSSAYTGDGYWQDLEILFEEYYLKRCSL